MKKPSAILLILFFLLAGFRTDEINPAEKILTDGFIDITVESNINRVFFTYPLAGISLNDAGDPGNEESPTVDITVPVRDFRCANETAFRDFVTLLKADQYPTLSISIPQQNLTRNAQKESITIHNLMINIAGVTRKYDISCRAENTETEDYFIIGTLKVRLTDLNIRPPVKYFGLVKIKDEVIVKFGFSYKDYHLAVSKDSG